MGGSGCSKPRRAALHPQGSVEFRVARQVACGAWNRTGTYLAAEIRRRETSHRVCTTSRMPIFIQANLLANVRTGQQTIISCWGKSPFPQRGMSLSIVVSLTPFQGEIRN